MVLGDHRIAELVVLVVEFDDRAGQGIAFLQTEANPLGLAWQWGTTSGLTMGQILSIPMILIGLAVLLAARRGRWAREAA